MRLFTYSFLEFLLSSIPHLNSVLLFTNQAFNVLDTLDGIRTLAVGENEAVVPCPQLSLHLAQEKFLYSTDFMELLYVKPWFR